MTEQEKREKVIKGLEICSAGEWNSTGGRDHTDCPYYPAGYTGCTCKLLMRDALALLKAQEKATIEPKCICLDDETKAWLDKMDAVDVLSNIANICVGWDGYRTADGLGGLINEIWAYARYSADRLLKAQEPVKPVWHECNEYIGYFACGACGANMGTSPKYCWYCGRKVKWE